MQSNPFSRESLLAALRAQSTGRAVLANPGGSSLPASGLPGSALPGSLAHPALGLSFVQPQSSVANLAALSAAVQLQAAAQATAAAVPAAVQSPDAALAAAQEAANAAKLQRQKEEKAQKEAEKVKKEAEQKAEGEKLRCHLHSKHNNKCKACQRHKDFLDKGKEEKAAVKEKFASALRGGRKQDAEASKGNSGVRLLEIANTKTFGFPPLLQTQLVESQYYKTVMLMESMEQVVDELYTYADSVEPYAPHSVQAPSALFVCVYRLFTLGIDGRQLKQLLENDDSPFVRCAGFLFLRYGVAPDQLWPWLGEYVLDEEDFQGKIKDAEWGSTVGEFVEHLLSNDYYCKTVLPRLPVTTKRQIEGKLAQVPQYRKRARANRRKLHIFREKGVRVEAIPNDVDWLAGETVALLEDNSLRLRVRIRFDDGQEQVVAIGKVILVDARGSRSRSRSPGSGAASAAGGGIDWSRDKGRSTAELLEDIRSRDRDKAVCTSGKEYSQRRVNSFQIAMPLEQGNNSYGLAREETTNTGKSRGARERSRSREADRKKENSAEHQAKMKALFEKYGMQKPTQTNRQTSDIERPDVMRLG
eukprot:TRINITY_DN31430_c0_g1_i1.p1 TRINITY_DN31430_c0_g1~~TRINITY_DN31430_c0_g1_i1.p1  ORF type:complete len:587 (+),score=131.14 TRINITY_DN31430_c0_g1_i1:153-1913(+)